MRKDGETVSIEPQVFDLLQLLVLNRDRVVTKEEIHETIWQGRVVSDSALSNRIKAARKALGDSGREQSYIQTYHGRGFRFVAKVIRTGQSDEPVKSTMNSSDFPNGLSIAVLPFANMSGDMEQEYFSDGITEDITTDLARINGLFVVARNSSFSYKNTSVKVQTICENLEVRYLLEGSVRKDGNCVRITAQLIDGMTGGHLWAQRYDRDISDVFAVQSEISCCIVDALKLVLHPNAEQAIQKPPTSSIEAYNCYLRGREFFHRVTRKDVIFAQQMFTRAIEIDTNYTRAYAGLADCYARLYQYYDSNPEHLKQGIAASTTALNMDPHLAEAHASRGLLLSLKLDYKNAEKEFETALRIDPMLYEAYYFFGRVCFIRGDTEKAVELFQQACRVRPGDFQSMMMLANAYRNLDKLLEARKIAPRGLIFAERRLALYPDDVRAAYAGAAALIDLGDRKAALEWVERVLSIESEDTTTSYNLACLYSLLGEPDKAIDNLSHAINDENIKSRREWINHDRDLDSLRDLPRFQALLKQLQ